MGKEEIIRTLYDHFFSQAFPRMSEHLGIVFTPVEVMDFIIRSGTTRCSRPLGRASGNPRVAIIEITAAIWIRDTGHLRVGARRHTFDHERARPGKHLVGPFA